MDTDYKDDEELQLEKLVFGDQAGFEASLREADHLYEYSDDEQLMDGESDEEPLGDGFFIDEGGDAAMDIHQESGSSENSGAARLLAAWEDSDDDRNTIDMTTSQAKALRHTYSETQTAGSEYVARLRAQYEKIYARPEWVQRWERPEDFSKRKPRLEDNDSMSEEEEDSQVGANPAQLSEILAATSTFVRASSKTLPAHKISIVRLADANVARRSKSGVSSVHFHGQSALMVTGGLDRTLRVYHIDGKANAFVSSVHFRNMPVATCQFSMRPGSSMVFAGGRRRHMHRWDMRSGSVEKVSRMYGQDSKQRSYEYFVGSPQGSYLALRADDGWVNLLNAVTGQLVRSFKVDGAVADLAFTADDSVLVVAALGGDIYEFDTGSGRVLRKWADSAAVRVTKLALGGADRWLAVGTASGVVNVFERLPDADPRLVREVGNLVTQISALRFSHDGQVLAMASQSKKDAFRLVHMPSAMVFANWPTSTTPLGRVTDVAFSYNSQMLAIANDVGRVTLWRLNHY